MTSVGEINTVLKTRTSPMSRLVGFRRMKGKTSVVVKTIDLTVEQMRKIGTHHKIRGMHGKPKKWLADAFVKYLAIRQKEEESGNVESRDSYDVSINTKRWLNVLFSQAIKHKLATRGGTFTRNDL